MNAGKMAPSEGAVKKRSRRAAADSKRSASSAAPVRAGKKPVSKSQPTTTPARDRASGAQATPTPAEREVLIARIAYFRAEARGFAPGHELSDWYAAEAELDAQLAPDR